MQKNAYCHWGATITAKIYCPAHFFQSQWDWTGLRSSYLPSNECHVLSLVGLILGLIMLKPPWTVPFSGPPPQGSRHIASFWQESVQMCWNKPGECVYQVSLLYHLVGLPNWVAIWVANFWFGPPTTAKNATLYRPSTPMVLLKFQNFTLRWPRNRFAPEWVATKAKSLILAWGGVEGQR